MTHEPALGAEIAQNVGSSEMLAVVAGDLKSLAHLADALQASVGALARNAGASLDDQKIETIQGLDFIVQRLFALAERASGSAACAGGAHASAPSAGVASAENAERQIAQRVSGVCELF